MRCFTGVTDPELKKEFLKQPTKDSVTLAEVADTYEMARRYVKAMGTPKANSAQPKGKGKSNKPKSNTTKTSNDCGKAKQLAEEGKCFRCGQKFESRASHKPDCKAKDHKCKHCGKVGHFPNICLSGGQAIDKSKKGTQVKSNSAKPSRQAESDSGSESEAAVNSSRA